MRNRLPGLAVVALALLSSASPRAAQAPKAPAAPAPKPAATQPARTAAAQTPKPAAAEKLPPLSYVCTMPGDEDVLEDKPGNCPKCKMTLVPIRLDAKWWCPVHQALEVHDGPGTCRRDGRDLVQVTVSVSWTCADAPDKKLLEPGKCADGSARQVGYELRAHGDHNPRHGGQFFMATDAWHHIEGTYPQSGLMRMFFYDNFTKPLALKGKGMSGSVVIRDKADKEIATLPLVIGRNGSTMEATVPPVNAALPLRATVKMKFSATMAEQPFDFTFSEFSKDTATGTPSGPTSTPRPTTTGAVNAAPKPPAAAPTSASTAAARPPAATPAPAPAAAPTAAATTQQEAAAGPPDLYAGEIAPMPPALAAALNEDVLPKSIPELVAELANRTGQIDALVREGNLAEVWLPAMGTKTVALVLEQHASVLSAQKRTIVTLAVKRVVSSAWEIDGYGDLGNKAKIVEAYERLSAAVADLKAAYEGIR